MSSAETFFQQKILILVMSGNINVITFKYIFSNSFDFYWDYQGCIINMIAILTISAKLAALGFIKMQVY